MADLKPVDGPVEIKVAWLSAAERARETALLARFAEFWGTATGTSRAIYDKFVAASPMIHGVTVEEVTTADVQGWWLRPTRKPATGQAILFIHGGGYVQGTAAAYRGFVSQIVSRTTFPRWRSTTRSRPKRPSRPRRTLRSQPMTI